MAEECELANVLCSLDEVNGYACNNPSTVASPCQPLCSQGVWVTIPVGGLLCLRGKCDHHINHRELYKLTRYSIRNLGDCNCGQEVVCRSIPCIPPNSTSTATATLIPCKTYYLWVDGCSGIFVILRLILLVEGHLP